MQAASIPALAISIAALAISCYGVAERWRATRAAERVRFATLVDELNNLRLEHVKLTANMRYGDVTDALYGRTELLAVQAFAMVRKLRRTIASPEYRTLANALGRAGYPAEAEQIWAAAIRRAAAEGPTQALYAHRGFAYFLFPLGRWDEARAQMESAVEVVGSADDTARVHQIRTLKYWAVAEREAERGGPVAANLMTKAEQVVAALDSAQTRRHMREFLRKDEAAGS